MRRSIWLVMGIWLCCIAICHAQVPTQTVYLLPGGALTLTANPANAPRYQWIKDGTPIASATSFNYIVNQPGTYMVISYSDTGCSSDLSAPINVLINPVSKFADVAISLEPANQNAAPSEVVDYVLKVINNGPDIANSILVKTLLADKVEFTAFASPFVGVANYDQTTNSVTWQLSKLTVEETAELKIRIKVPKWGSVKSSATVSASEKDPKLVNNTAIYIQSIIAIKVPNVFTPNNDGKNDQFVISGLENYASNEITIINRWGSSVYEKKNYGNDWTANGLSDGTYFYVLRVKTVASEWQEIKGYLTVIR